MNVDALLDWYAAGHRPLPWRATRDPWALLVCEVMLQQTQAARVVPHWERFLGRFPTAAVCAGAPAATVLTAWSGLGYNRRALRLHDAAKAVAARGWPRDAAGLRELPGVGPYTAAAVASFAWDEPVAAVDTNVRRVLERRDGRRHPPAALARRAAGLLPPRRAAAFNQAMMELGATVCRPRRADCGACPVRADCATAAGAPPPEPPVRRRPERFEHSDRRLRGRVVAALVAGAELPVDPRLDRILEALERDGLVVRSGGEVRLP